MRTLCERTRVRPFGFHAIRHLTASILYRLGQPVSVIQAILRHKSPNTTALYLKSLGLEETRGALESLSARHAGVTHSFAATTAAGQVGKVISFPSPDGEKAVVRIRRRTKRGVCARVSFFPELEAAGCRVMRSLYPCGAGCAQRSPDNHRTAATVIASAERTPYVAEDDSNFLSGGLSTLPSPFARHALVDEAPHVLRQSRPASGRQR